MLTNCLIKAKNALLLVAFCAVMVVMPATASENQYDEFNSNSYPLSSSNDVSSAFYQSLPNDVDGLTAQIDILLRQRLDEWYYPDLGELGRWIVKCDMVTYKLISVAGEQNDPTKNNCAYAWDAARITVTRMLPHSQPEEEEPIASEHKAAALAAILKAESIYGAAHESVMPPLAPRRHLASLPSIAPNRTTNTNQPIDDANLSARDPQPAQNSLSPAAEVPKIIQGEAGKHFSSPNEALRNWTKYVLEPSKRLAIEHAGQLYQNWDGTWSYSPSFPGAEGSSSPEKGEPYVLVHGNPFRSYAIHTHGDYRAKVSRNDGTTYYRNLTANEQKSVNEFSPKDQMKGVRSGYPQFMLTPGGMLREFIPDPLSHLTYSITGAKGETINIGNINDPHWDEPTGL